MCAAATRNVEAGNTRSIGAINSGPAILSRALCEAHLNAPRRMASSINDHPWILGPSQGNRAGNQAAASLVESWLGKTGQVG